MEIPFVNLKAQYGRIKKEIEEALKKVLESQIFVLGEEVKTLEKEISSYCGVEYGIGVGSGTDALFLSLKAVGVKPGDGVVTTPFTFFSTAGVIHNLGGRIYFADIEEESFNLNPERVEEILKKEKGKIKALLPVHLFGQMAEMEAFLELGEKYEVKVVEDAAQAIGAEYKGKKAGSWGTCGCFSFFPTKNLGGYGDGGMVVTREGELAQRIKMLRVHGQEKRYFHRIVGYNSRLDSIQAAVLRVKLRYLERWIGKRRKNASFYERLFREEGLLERIILPQEKPEMKHTFHQYTIRIKGGLRERVREFLHKEGVGSFIYYPVPLHLQECFSYLGYQKGDFPVAEKIAREVLSLPIYPELTSSQQEYVVEKIKEALTT